MFRRLEIEGYSDYYHACHVRKTCKGEEGSRLFVASSCTDKDLAIFLYVLDFIFGYLIFIHIYCEYLNLPLNLTHSKHDSIAVILAIYNAKCVIVIIDSRSRA